MSEEKISAHLSELAKSNMHNIEHVHAIREYIENMEATIELRDIEIQRLSTYCWNVSTANIM
jgi:hypothetical protein